MHSGPKLMGDNQWTLASMFISMPKTPVSSFWDSFRTRVSTSTWVGPSLLFTLCNEAPIDRFQPWPLHSKSTQKAPGYHTVPYYLLCMLTVKHTSTTFHILTTEHTNGFKLFCPRLISLQPFRCLVQQFFYGSLRRPWRSKAAQSHMPMMIHHLGVHL